MLTDLVGRRCQGVEKHEFSWSFDFGDGYSLSVECPWRLIVDGRIVLAHADHDQQFGLPERMDASLTASTLLSEKKVTDIVANGAGDVTILFNDVRLEVFNDSSGYESWVLSCPEIIVVGRNE